MIRKEQARMLEVFQKHGAQATHVITDMGFGGIDLLALIEMGAIQNQLDKRWTITDTGRLALEEFEGAQAVSADASPVVSDAAKIAALEAENAALRGLLAKALDAIAPFEDARDDWSDLSPDKEIQIEEDDLWIGDMPIMAKLHLQVKHLRAIATIASGIRAALDPTTPYEDTPDGSDLLARDTEADDDE